MRNFELPGRSMAVARQGMAATSHPAATLTAVEILKAGGHAIDAAVAACAVQCVVEAGSTGIGGDCFAMLSVQGSTDIRAYNGSGRAPSGVSLAALRAAGVSRIERHSPLAVTVPGAVEAWCRLVADHGKPSHLLAVVLGVSDDPVPGDQLRRDVSGVADRHGVGEGVKLLLGIGLLGQILHGHGAGEFGMGHRCILGSGCSGSRQAPRWIMGKAVERRHEAVEGPAT
jgi:hypothetical protein